MNIGDVIVGLDIGTSKIAAIVGEVASADCINVIGLGSCPSGGVKCGMVVNIENTVESIQQVVEEARLMADIRVSQVYVSISGGHIYSTNSQGTVAVSNREVRQSDIDRSLDAALALSLPKDQQLIHILSQEYIIDKQGGIRYPLGMSGVRLEAQVHLVTSDEGARRNIEKCIQVCGLDAEAFILSQLASSLAILTEDEKELGVCLVDIGGGTTDIAVFTNGSLQHSGVIPIAGDYITNDIATAFRTPTLDAERLKVNYACAWSDLVGPEEIIKVPSIGNCGSNDLSRQTLCGVVEPRYREILDFVQEQLGQNNFNDGLVGGIVLTGGTSKMQGSAELAEDIFHLPVRIGEPQYVRGMKDMINDPAYATGIGLLQYALTIREPLPTHPKRKLMRSQRSNSWRKSLDWFREQF